MQYKVTKQYTRGPETTLQTFKQYDEAARFIQTKLAEDIRFNVQSVYRIYEFDDLLKEFTQADAKVTSFSSTSSQGAQAGQTQRFSPSPFNLTPTLGPHSWIKDVENKE